MKPIVAALIVSLIALPVRAEGTNFVTDSPSPFAHPTTDAMGETHFSGRAVVSGNFVALWEDPGEGEVPYLVVRFRPDSKSKSVLPYETGRNQVEEVWLSNTDKALALLVPQSTRIQLIAKRVTKAEGVARIVITSYTTRVDCDVRGYSARILSARLRAKVVTAQVPFREASC